MAYTSAQIVAMACQIAKVPGYTSMGGQLLNMILADLCQRYDFDFIRTVTTVNLNSGNPPLTGYAMPSNYLRAREVFYYISGVPTFMNQEPLSDYDASFAGPGFQNYPTTFATDVGQNPVLMYFWPTPSVSIPVTVRYQPQMADITTPESSTVVPWFPNQVYLIKRLAGELMMISDDTRAMEFKKDAADVLRLFLEMDDDKEGYARQVLLDKRMFPGQGSNRVTKSQPL